MNHLLEHIKEKIKDEDSTEHTTENTEFCDLKNGATNLITVSKDITPPTYVYIKGEQTYF